MAKRISLSIKDNKVLKCIVLSFIYIFVSLSTFYAIKIFFPLISNYGLNSLSIIPAFLTYIMPLFLMFMGFLFIHSTKKEHMRFNMMITSLILFLFGLFGVIMSIILMTIVYNGKVVVGNLTYLFPLDILLINILYILLSICLHLIKNMDVKNNFLHPRCVEKVGALRKTMLGFYLPFSTYFFGQFLYGFMYVFEGYWSPNWYGMIPAYFLFAAMTFSLILFVIYFHNHKNNKNRLALICLISSFLYVFIFGIWFIIANIINPYLLSESLQWELSILYSIKYPFGLLIASLGALIPTIYYVIRFLIKLSKEKNKANEQE